MKNKKIGIPEVIEKFGGEPDKVIQIQALTGDKVDNIPGALGIGPKTALELIKEYGDIEGLIKNVDKIKERIEQKKDLFDRNYKYIVVKIDESFPKYLLNNKKKLNNFIYIN